MIGVFIAISITACVMAQGDAAVDVAYPGGTVQVNKDTPAVVAAPATAAGATDQPGAPASLAPQTPMSRAERRRLRKEMRARSSANVDVSYPFGSVVVRRGSQDGDGEKNVNVVYPGGSVNVGGRGSVPEGGKPAVDVEYPGGSVHLQPRQPGERRKGYIEFPFGRVVLS